MKRLNEWERFGMVSKKKKAIFVIEEYGTNVKSKLLMRGIPKRIFDCTVQDDDVSVYKYSVIDPVKLSFEEVCVDRDSIILCVNATKENVREVIGIFKNQIVIPFDNLAGCVEFMYIYVAQSAYSAFMGIDLENIIKTLEIRGRKRNIKIVRCVDLLQLNQVPEEAKIFMSNVVYSYDEVFGLVGTGKLLKILEMFRKDSRAAIVVSPMRGSYQKIFWSE